MASPSASPEVYGPVPSGRAASGRLAVPGSKSLTQRYFNLALLGRSPLVVHRPLLSEDTRNFLAGLEVTGFDVTHGVDRVTLNPNERRAGEAAPSGDIWCGAGGTMFRFLTAALTTVPGAWRLDGIPRLRERTVAPLLAALRQLGAELHCPGGEGFAPLDIVGGSLRGGHAVLDSGVSSQFLSALLMAGTVTPEPVSVEVAALTSEPYVDLTLDAIAEMGGAVTREGQVFRVEGRRPAADAITVEADFSAVAYPAAAAALTGGRVHVESLSPASRQGDRGFVDLLTRMGAEVAWRDGGLEVAGGPLHAVTESLEAMPDQVPTLAALAPFARGTTR
ncbi:MAG: 3-phosphoshikimate 1-carboxyvinyltransferase, partial [Acidobacteriota bacterium]